MKIEQRVISLKPFGGAAASWMLQLRMVAHDGTVLGQETVGLRGPVTRFMTKPSPLAMRRARAKALKAIEKRLADLVKQADKQQDKQR